MKIIQKRWDSLEKPHKKIPAVYRWFALQIAPIIRENMHSELLPDLGLEEEKYTQNHSESLNALVKRYVSFQKQNVLEFVNDLKECVHEQQNEVDKAIIGLGRWKVSPCYAHIRQKTSSWFGSMSLAEKWDTLSSIHKASPVFSTSSINANSLGIDAHEGPDNTLSVPCTSIEGLLLEGQVQSIWKKHRIY